MPDIIQLLPDSVANQIAAGEVIQRPASIVKELIENAVDAGSLSVKVIIKDAGKTLVQVVDNGCGMSETDARLAFERHATSKIREANDLFAIRTNGFRGEALASIAAVAQVDLKTKRTEDEIGTLVTIKGSRVETQEPVSCADGCNFSVKNLFFNVPARRKFLKADSTEFKHILNEFYRVVLANPQIEFSLYNDTTEVHHLPPANIKQRVLHLFGKNINSKLVTLDSDTTVVKISGFIGKPDSARKSAKEQFFFVNNRFMRHPYFYKAVLQVFDQLIQPDTQPVFFIYMETDPSTIDVNIHPTKTEIKFENEQVIWKILQSAVKEGLGKFNVAPALDFDREGVVEIPVLRKNQEVKAPVEKFNPYYNPFEEEEKRTSNKQHEHARKDENTAHWEKLFQENMTGSYPEETTNSSTDENLLNMHAPPLFLQFKQKFILTPVKSGLMIIDQKKAHERILFEMYLDNLESSSGISQKSLYPVKIELNAADYVILAEIMDDLHQLGFSISELGDNTIAVNGCPADTCSDPSILVENLLNEYKETQNDIKISSRENLAKSLAKATSIYHGQILNTEEMRILTDKLFACKSPNYSPDGKLVITIVSMDEIEKKFR